MNVPMRYYHPSIKDVGGVRKIVKNLSPNFDAQKMSYTQKFKIPLPKPPLGGSNKCSYVILSPFDQKCRRSSQKREKI